MPPQTYPQRQSDKRFVLILIFHFNILMQNYIFGTSESENTDYTYILCIKIRFLQHIYVHQSLFEKFCKLLLLFMSSAASSALLLPERSLSTCGLNSGGDKEIEMAALY